MDMGPLAKVRPENGSGFSLATGLTVRCGGLVQTDMGLNQSQRLCGPLMVWDIAKNGYDGAD